ISPEAGTPDASPQTGISVLGAKPKDITSVTATGSQSGAHKGKLLPFSGQRGAIFTPSDKFTEGETVKAVVNVRGRKAVKLSFTIARLGATPPVLNLPNTQPAKLQHFQSEPDMTPPKISVLKGASSSGDNVFLTPLPSPIVHP